MSLLPPGLMGFETTVFPRPGECQVRGSLAEPLFAPQYVTGHHLLTSESSEVGTFLPTGKSPSFSLLPVFLLCSQETSATAKINFNNFQSHETGSREAILAYQGTY